MKDKIKHIKRPFSREAIAALAVFVLFMLYYALLLYRHTSSDIQAHAKIAYSYVVNHDKLFPNFLYFLLLAVFAGFSQNLYVYYGASILLISAALAAKFIITHRYYQKFCTQYKNDLASFLPAIAMLFVFALPALNFFQANEYYHGLLPPNVWHNSTVIFLMPFSLLLFFKTYESLFAENAGSYKVQWQIFLLVILNALIKPSFLFTLIPTVGIFFVCLKAFSSTRVKFTALFPFIAGVVFIAIEYYLIYQEAQVSTVANTESTSSVVWAPFVVWRYYSSNILLSFIASCFFPLIYLLVSKGRLLKNRLVQFAVVNYIIGLAIWILFAEEGFRKFHANFCWQAIIAAYLLFFVLLLQFINDSRTGKLTRLQRNIAGGAFVLHFIWGLIYWIKIIIFIDYV